jgi:hypothetical protein
VSSKNTRVPKSKRRAAAAAVGWRKYGDVITPEKRVKLVSLSTFHAWA